jgi:hypothetical protein
MKNKLKTIILVFFAIFGSSFAQSITSGYFVVPNDALDASVQEQLGNKIKSVLSKANVIATDSYFPMVTIVKYDEIETIELQGLRKMYKTKGVVTIIVTFANTNAALATEELDVEGVGVSKKVSQATAVKNINFPVETLQKMMEKAKVGYDKSMAQFTAGKLASAKKFKAAKDYNKALEELKDIPKESKDFAEANKIINEIEKLIDQDAKAEQIRQDKEKERQYELQKQQMQNEKELAIEQQKTNRTEIDARARVEERYYRAWQAYYSGR